MKTLPTINREGFEVEPISNQSVKSLDCGNESIERGPLARTFRLIKEIKENKLLFLAPAVSS